MPQQSYLSQTEIKRNGMNGTHGDNMSWIAGLGALGASVAADTRFRPRSRSQPHSRRQLTAFLFQTGDLLVICARMFCASSCTAVLLICCVWCLTNDRVLTRVSPYTVRSMAFLPLLRLARVLIGRGTAAAPCPRYPLWSRR